MITKATLKDIPDLVKLREDFCKEDLHEFNKVLTIKLFKEVIKNSKIGEIFIYKKLSQVIGYAFMVKTYSLEFYGKDMLLDELYISPKFRDKKLGSKLFNHILKRGKQLNLSYIHLEVMDTNFKVLSFYKKKGLRKRLSSHYVMPLSKKIKLVSAVDWK